MKILYIIFLVILGMVVIFPWLMRLLMWLLQRKLKKSFEQNGMFGAFGQQQQRHEDEVVFEDAEVTVLEGDARATESKDNPAKKHSTVIRDADYRDT